jgi:hypothetical protein
MGLPTKGVVAIEHGIRTRQVNTTGAALHHWLHFMSRCSTYRNIVALITSRGLTTAPQPYAEYNHQDNYEEFHHAFTEWRDKSVDTL